MKRLLVVILAALLALAFSSCNVGSDPTIKAEDTTASVTTEETKGADKTDPSGVVTLAPTNNETKAEVVTTVPETTAETKAETTAPVEKGVITVNDFVTSFTMSVTDANDNTAEVRIYGKIQYKILSVVDMGNASAENSFSREDWINDTLYNLILEYVDANSPMTLDEFRAQSAAVANYVMQNRNRSAAASFMTLESFEITNLVKEN